MKFKEGIKQLIMLQRLTKEESETHSKAQKQGTDYWWVGLSDEERNRVRSVMQPIMNQITCEHDWYPTKMYDKFIQVCSNCDLKK